MSMFATDSPAGARAVDNTPLAGRVLRQRDNIDTAHEYLTRIESVYFEGSPQSKPSPERNEVARPVQPISHELDLSLGRSHELVSRLESLCARLGC